MTLNAEDVRWEQRLPNFCKAFAQLGEAVALMQVRELSRLEKQGGYPGLRVHLRAGLEYLEGFPDMAGYRRHYRLTGYYPGSIQQGAH